MIYKYPCSSLGVYISAWPIIDRPITSLYESEFCLKGLREIIEGIEGSQLHSSFAPPV